MTTSCKALIFIVKGWPDPYPIVFAAEYFKQRFRGMPEVLRNEMEQNLGAAKRNLATAVVCCL